MTARGRFVALTVALALPGFGIVPVAAQAPAPTITQPSPAPAPQSAPAKPARPTLIPEPGDPVNVDEVELPEKPVLILNGSGGWDDGLKVLKESFAKIEAELAKRGITPTGRPLVLYTQTTDDTFKFEAMIPIAAAPAPPPALPAEMRFGTTPSGKAYRFTHKAPYDDIDSTYETITTYLEAKDIVAKDAFMEEFVTDPSDSADAEVEVNIYVQPK